jgi:amidase
MVTDSKDSGNQGLSEAGIIPPTLEELGEIAREYGLNLSSEHLAAFNELIAGAILSYMRLEELEEPKFPVKYHRERGHRPSAKENPLNAWYWQCSIKGAKTGKLAGKKVALKDNICVAGIPLMNGSSVMEGFVPDIDATVVTRILDAGGEITGKAVCEAFSFSGASFTSATGPVLNPHNHAFNAGGSSSGSASLVVNGDCDMAMGGDQGGSIRIPSSWSGAYGLKPTHGLVPYTGIFPMEATLDHTGPIAMNVENVALLLEAVAGKDPLDPRQREVITRPYTEALTGDVKDLTFGIVKEGFDWEGASEEDVDSSVRSAAERFKALGADVTEVSIPMHRDGMHIWFAIVGEGALSQMILHNGMGRNWQGYYHTEMVDYFGKAKKELADQFPDTVKFTILLGHYMMNKYYGKYYAKAQNLVSGLREAYDDILKDIDVLIMPTTPMKAMPIIEDPTFAEYFGTAFGMFQNTCPFDCTHHPAMSVPCAKSDGLPIGMMLIGRHFEEDIVLRAAHAFEMAGIYR